MAFMKTAFALTFFLALFTGCQDNERELQNTEQQLDSLSQELSRYKKTADSLKALIEKGDIAANYPIYFGKEFDSIEDPKEMIKTALKKHPEIIPLDPVVGGSMQFREVKVLTNDWVLGIYDDGHIQGKSIYRYKLQPNGRLDFEHVTSAEPQE
ncbi:hypothetical protein V6B16_12720 [Salinimicrobium catena]|uniref:hypothetical protein n=1 Tax=Salinimicrobium catena TaxID=390640 RepID=UPI002FE4BDD8